MHFDESRGLQSFLQSQRCDVYGAANGESSGQLRPGGAAGFSSPVRQFTRHRSFELCRQLKKDPLNELTPVVVVSHHRTSGTSTVETKPGP